MKWNRTVVALAFVVGLMFTLTACPEAEQSPVTTNNTTTNTGGTGGSGGASGSGGNSGIVKCSPNTAGKTTVPTVMEALLTCDTRQNRTLRPARDDLYTPDDTTTWSQVIAALGATTAPTNLNKQLPPADACGATGSTFVSPGGTVAFTFAAGDTISYFSPDLAISETRAKEMALLAEAAWWLIRDRTGNPAEAAQFPKLHVCWEKKGGSDDSFPSGSKPGPSSVIIRSAWTENTTDPLFEFNRTNFFQLVEHEAAHLLLAAMRGQVAQNSSGIPRNIPAWIDEGFCLWVSNQGGYSLASEWDKFIASTQAASRSLPHLIDGTGMYQGKLVSDDSINYYTSFETMFRVVFASGHYPGSNLSTYYALLRDYKAKKAAQTTTPTTCGNPAPYREQERCYREAFDAAPLKAPDGSDMSLDQFHAGYVAEVPKAMGNKAATLRFSGGADLGKMLGGGLFAPGLNATQVAQNAKNPIAGAESNNADGSLTFSVEGVPAGNYTFGFSTDVNKICAEAIALSFDAASKPIVTPTELDLGPNSRDCITLN